MRKIFISTLLFVLTIVGIPYLCVSQNSTQVKADKYYGTLNFAKAIPYYEALVKKYNNDVNPVVLTRLADSYRLTNNYKKAAEIYKKLTNDPNSDDIIKYYYAKALLSEGNINDAAGFFKLYQNDYRGEYYFNSIQNISELYKDTASYKLSKTSFNSIHNDFSPFILDDNRIVFVSSRPTAKWINYTHGWTNKRYLHIFVTEKNKKGEYKKPKLFSCKVQTYLNNGPATFSSDRTKMIFTRNNVFNNKIVRGGNGDSKLQIYQSVYDIQKNKYVDLFYFQYNDPNYNFAHPSISQNGKLLFFSSDKPGGYGGMDIWVSIRTDDKWSEPINLGSRVNTPGNEVFPYIHGNDELYFSSDGLGGLGGLDVFKTVVDVLGMPAGKSFNMGANFNSYDDDFGVAFQNDGKKGFISSNRNGKGLNDDIFEVEIVKPVIQKIIIKGVAYDINTNIPLPDAKITLYDNNWNVNDYVYTNSNGSFSFLADYDQKFNLLADKEHYSQSLRAVSTFNIPDKKEIISDIYLEPGDGKIKIPEKTLPQEPVTEPVVEPVTEPVVEPVTEPVATHQPEIVQEEVVVTEPVKEPTTPLRGTLLPEPVVFKITVVDGATSNPLSGVKIRLTDNKTSKIEEFYTTSSGTAEKVLSNAKIGDNVDWIFNFSLKDYLPREKSFEYSIIRSGVVNIDETMFKIEKGQEVGIAININPIYFDYDKYDIRPDAKVELDKVVSILKQYPDIKIELGSHTDCRGSVEYNYNLSLKRAKASQDYLISKGISKNRIIAKGYGETKLVNNCSCDDVDTDNKCSEYEHQLNRRTEFVIIRH